MSHVIKKDQSVAFVMSSRIGDTLFSMVIVQNLVRNGYDVTVFSSHLTALRDWFPDFHICPAVTPDMARSVLGRYDVVLHAYAADVVDNEIRSWHPRAWVMDEWPVYRQTKPMIDIQLDVCRRSFGLSDVTRTNGLVIPAHVSQTVVPNRAVIHPSASYLHKQWLPKRFAKLAVQLREQGYDTCFVVAPHERRQWQWIEALGFLLVTHASLAELAEWLVPTGLFVGNDSGLAHLASNLGVPAISLAMRRGIARRWAPAWSPTITLSPMQIIPGRWWPQEVLWKHLLPVSRVLSAIQKLKKIVAGTPRAFDANPIARPRTHECAPVLDVAGAAYRRAPASNVDALAHAEVVVSTDSVGS
jgi:hypothetical protein